jgi:hypothetical protein
LLELYKGSAAFAMQHSHHSRLGRSWLYLYITCAQPQMGLPRMLVAVAVAVLCCRQVVADFDACPVQDPDSATYEDLV